MLVQPETRYAKSGDVSIAYQIVGGGPIDIVFVNGFVGNLEVQAENARDQAFFERLASLGRVIGSTAAALGYPTGFARCRRSRHAWTTSAL